MTSQPFEVYPPKGKTLILGLLGLGMTALSFLPLWLAWTGQEEALLMVPIGVIGVLFFGAATLAAVRAFVSPKPILRVDDAGIHVWRYPSLHWDEFAYAEIGASGREVFLVIHTHDNDAYRARMVWYRRLWARGNAALIEGAVYLSERLLPEPAEVLARRITDAAPTSP